MKNLYRVDFRGMYGDDVYVTATGYDEAANKALKIKIAEEEENPKPLLDEDGSLTINKKERKILVRSVELLRENIRLD